MGALLNRRRYMGGGAAPLPYDAEVEYIQSNGTQLVNLGYYPNPQTILEMEIQFVSIGNEDKQNMRNTIFGTANTTSAIFSSNFGSQTSQKNAIYIWNYKKIGKGGSVKTISITAITNKGTFLINPSYCSFLGRGVSLTTKTTTNTTPLYMFGNTTTALNRWGMKMFSLNIKEGNSVILDMIPVRIGAIGYLYDKVSKQLFGNNGTGDFILGPDV